MKDPGMAVLVNLAQRCRRAKRAKRELKKRAARYELDDIDFTGLLREASSVENEAWNALQASKSIYFDLRLKNQQKETN